MSTSILRRKSPPSAEKTNRYVKANAAIGVRKIWPSNCPVKPTRAINEPTAWRLSIRWSRHGLFSKVPPVGRKRGLFFLHFDLGEWRSEWVSIRDEEPKHPGEATI
jgi:hypothetical protein